MSANREMRYDNHDIHILYTLWENASSTSRIRHGEETGLCKCYRVCAFNCRADVYSRLSVIAFAINKGFSSDREITLMSKIRDTSSWTDVNKERYPYPRSFNLLNLNWSPLVKAVIKKSQRKSVYHWKHAFFYVSNCDNKVSLKNQQ